MSTPSIESVGSPLLASAAGEKGDGPTEVAVEPEPLRLAGPTLDEYELVDPVHEPHEEGLSRGALVESFEVDIYRSKGDRWPIGFARIGTRLRVDDDGDRCDGGVWVRVHGRAYACTGEGLKLADSYDETPVLDRRDRGRIADTDESQPYRYARVTPDRAPELERLPSASEAESLAEGENPNGVVDRWLQGTYFIALSREIEHEGHSYWETIYDTYLRTEDLDMQPVRQMHGERLGDEYRLPLAFALNETPLLCVDGDTVSECGVAEKHARFNVEDRIEKDGRELVVGPDGIAIAAEDARVLETIDRPDGVSSEAKWVHIPLDRQGLIAYEGDTPVYATLVSSGLRSHATPTGLYRVDRKYLSKTMRGTDKNGPYEVGEVPWTMYYHNNYAVHGAYWHDRFGYTKSHGCTNVPPADARWLYYWASVDLPEGWHSRYDRLGTYVYNTGETPADDQ